ncbi:MAG: zinc-ribbon domain-containing protein [Gemmatimonadaceae bacterium]
MNVSCPDCRSIFRVDPAKVPPNGVRARCSVCSGVITIPAPSGVNTPSASAPRTTTPATQTAPPFAPPAAPFNPPAPPSPPRTAEMPAPPRRRDESGPVTATATPPSPSGSVPEFRSPPATPGFPPRAPSGPGPSAPPFVPGAPARPPVPPPAAAPVANSPIAPSAPAQRAATPSVTPPRAATPALSPPPTPPTPAPQPPRPVTPAGGSAAASDAASRRPLNPFLSKDPNQRAKRLARALVSDIITYHPAKHAEGLRDGTLKQLFRDEIKKSFEEYIAQVGQQLAEGTTYFQEALNEVLAGGKKIF